MTGSDYINTVKEDILTELVVRPLTIKDLQEILQIPYSTVQQAHKSLRTDGRIIPFDRKTRGGRFTIANIQSKMTTVPTVTLNSKFVKMTEFKVANDLNMAEVGHTVIRAWTKLATLASRLNNGLAEGPTQRILTVQRAELIKARAAAETLAFLITQMLDDPKFWDVDLLALFPMDKDWEEFVDYLPTMNDFYNEKAKE